VGNRLSKIYTRTGDGGTTGLGNGDRVAKDCPRVEAYGTVDELNSAIGLLRAQELPAATDELLADIQQQLFDLGGELCIPDSTTIASDMIDKLEAALDEMNAELPVLKEFVLPGGGRAGAACHLARAVCRRAERRVVTLSQTETVNELSIRYLNRLSDLLFVLARYLNKAAGAPEVLWRSSRSGDAD
jgi:cob(I)alamin adenosyltransferase